MREYHGHDPGTNALLVIHLSMMVLKFIIPAGVMLQDAMDVVLHDTRNFPGRGRVVTSIHSQEPGPGRAWFFEVNGAKSVIGMADYRVQPRDVIVWRMEDAAWGIAAE